MAENISVEEYSQQIKHATAIIESRIGGSSELKHPRVMIICGSGLGGIADTLDPSSIIEISYSEIPGFKTSTVQGHAGKLVFGLIGANKVPVMCMVGRLHFYEGYTFQQTTFPVRVASKIGVSTVIVTNAAGGINAEYKAGELMLIEDHINFPGLAGWHPLRGPNMEEFGPRFQPLSDAYDHELRKLFVTVAKDELKLTRKINEGTYFFAAGPTFESRAEVRLIRTLGGDAVGMSTVPEVIVARHCGLRVLALSLITNEGVGEKPPSALHENPKALDEGMASHDEVLETANEASKDVQKIIESVVNKL
ncbi:Purine nucleoside phosphorylase [Lodderomyces elongisporus]|uniref:Purine nucleoside phosphorylase n=1 Tax=Lodderomyces elongisporus TaxID=36914 RepID=UPI002923EEEF|nr:Purine nucleoside phosphorylase [Lodderomyces elongisporus]WLF78250.1 Purine nucleoside phosphorylase [Lodderomyces elongisporus]